MTEEEQPTSEEQQQIHDAGKDSNTSKTKSQKVRIGLLCAIGVIIILVAYFKFDSDAKAEAIVEVHNNMAAMSHTYANAVFSMQNRQEGSEDPLDNIFEESATACGNFHTGLKNMDLSKIPNDYREAFNRLIQLVEKEKQALENEDLTGFMETAMERKKLGGELKSIAKKHGLSSY